MRITEELRDAIKARADDEDESIESVLRRLLELPSLPERLSAVKDWPIASLDVGEETTIPWPKRADNGLADEEKVAQIKRAIYNYARKAQRAYRTVGSAAGLKVWRAK